MAEQKIVIKLTVDDKGQLKKSSAQAEKLTKSTDKAARSTDKLQKSRDKYNRTEKGVAQISSNSTKNFSKMQQSIGGEGGSGGLVRAYALLAANVFALTAAFGVLSRAAQVETLTESIKQLEIVSGRSIRSVARDLQGASGGSLDFANSLRSVSLASSAGFGTQQIKELGEVAKNASVALGRNLADGLDRIFRGVIKVEPELLDEIGLFVRVNDASQKYADTLGIAASDLTEFQKRQAFANEAITQGQQKFQAFSSIEPDAFSRIAASLTDMAQSALAFLNKGLLPIVDFLAKNKLFLGAVFALVAFTIGRQVLPALGTFATSSREAAEQAQKDFEAFSNNTKNRLNAASDERLKKVKDEIADTQAQFRKLQPGQDGAPLFQSRAKGVEQNLADIENKKLAATTRRAAVEKRISILKKAEVRANDANKVLIREELDNRKQQLGLLDTEIAKEKDLRNIKSGKVEKLGGQFATEEKRLEAKVTKALAIENISLTFSQEGLIASLRVLKAETISAAGGTASFTASLFTARGASTALGGALTVLGAQLSATLAKISPYLMVFALVAPFLTAIGKFFGLGSEEAKKFSAQVDTNNELLETLKEKLDNARRSLEDFNTTSTANLDALNASSTAILEMAQGLVQLRNDLIAFQVSATLTAKVLDVIGFGATRAEELLTQTAEAVSIMATDFDNLSDPLQRLFEQQLPRTVFEDIESLSAEVTKFEKEIAKREQERFDLRNKIRKKEISGTKDIEKAEERIFDLGKEIFSINIERQKIQEKVKSEVADNLKLNRVTLQVLEESIPLLEKQQQAGLSLKSALDGSKDAAAAFRRAFITKTDVDQPLASLRQVEQSLNNQFLRTENR